jgi:glucose-1-phosphate cytidylyltransferase
MTGGRLLRLEQHLQPYGTFMLTYGDGVSNVDIAALLAFHRTHGKLATVTAVRPLARFGGVHIGNGEVLDFKEKPQSGEGWINGGFFVFEPSIFNYLADDATVLEQSPLESLVRDKQLMAYEHTGYWQCMDTIRDRDALQSYCDSGEPPWMEGSK